MKRDKGITLISLIITIVLLLIITGTTVYTSVDRFKINNLKKMYNDIELLDDKVNNYYLKYGGLPVIKDAQNNPVSYTHTAIDFNKDVNDNNNYYIIDLLAIRDITLNYGKDGYESPNSSDDVYIINEKSHTVYYVRGIEYTDGNLYHSKKVDGDINEYTIPPTTPEINIISETDTSIEVEIIPGKDKQSGIEKTEYTINSVDINKNETSKTEEITERKVLEKLSKDKSYEIIAITTSKNGLTSEKKYTINEYIKKVNIGDYVNYDPTTDANGNAITGDKATYTSYSVDNASSDKNEGRTSGYTSDQVFNLSSYTGGWRVLGVDDKGQLELISAYTILTSSGSKYYLTGQKGYTDGPDELNAIAGMYGQGKGATGARSINVEDINKITRYNPTQTGDGKPYDSGNISEYGNKVTYFWDGTAKPYYEGTNAVSGNLTSTHNTFNWYDGANWQSSAKSTTASTSARERITELTSTYYYYYPTTLTTTDGTDIKGIEKTSDEWKILFENTNNDVKPYWLASPYVYCYSYYACFGVRTVNNEHVMALNLFNSDVTHTYSEYGVRPIVFLKFDIQIGEQVDGVWQIQ